MLINLKSSSPKGSTGVSRIVKSMRPHCGNLSLPVPSSWQVAVVVEALMIPAECSSSFNPSSPYYLGNKVWWMMVSQDSYLLPAIGFGDSGVTKGLILRLLFSNYMEGFLFLAESGMKCGTVSHQPVQMHHLRLHWECSGNLKSPLCLVWSEQGTGLNFGMTACGAGLIFREWWGPWKIWNRGGSDCLMWRVRKRWGGVKDGPTVFGLRQCKDRKTLNWDQVNKLVVGVILGVRFWPYWVCDVPKTSEWRYQVDSWTHKFGVQRRDYSWRHPQGGSQYVV